MESRPAPSGSLESAEATPTQYLTFELGTELYGIEILKIQEIVARMDITPVPRTPRCLKGVGNLRGKIIPILGLREVFEVPGEDPEARGCIVVTRTEVDGDAVTIGLLVDEASEVVRVPVSAIEKPSLLAGTRSLEFIDGIARLEGRIVFLLNLGRVFSEAERTAVRSTLARAAEVEERAGDDREASGGTPDGEDEPLEGEAVRDA